MSNVLKVVSLSIFGYNNKHKDCFSFENFLKFLSINLRAYNTLFFDWKIYLAVDKQSYAAYKNYFDFCKEKDVIHYLDILERKQLGRNMLYRVNPIKFADYTICRDIDALATFRERQAVEVWLNNNTIAHSINDNVVHSIPLMGGMVGFRKDAFDLSTIDTYIDYSSKGSDQDYLNRYVYPLVKNSITEHSILGIPARDENTYSYNYIQNVFIDTSDGSEHVKEFFSNSELLKQSNDLVKHIGEAGISKNGAHFWITHSDKVLNDKLVKIESEYSDIFAGIKDDYQSR